MDSQRFRALRATACSSVYYCRYPRAPLAVSDTVARAPPCVIRVTIPPPLRPDNNFSALSIARVFPSRAFDPPRVSLMKF